MFVKSAVNLFSKMKLEILSNLLKEVTGLTLKANKISSASLQGDEAPNELSTMTKPSIIFSTSTGILLQIQFQENLRVILSPRHLLVSVQIEM